jgi:putative transcriptional regulator
MADRLTNSLRAMRAAAGWTQAELAERVGVSRKTINTVENGVFVPSTVLALKLAHALDVRVEQLFALTDSETGNGDAGNDL